MPPLTTNQERIVALIELGYGRRQIAEELNVSDSTVRQAIRVLCAQFDCRTRELPEKVTEVNGR